MYMYAGDGTRSERDVRSYSTSQLVSLCSAGLGIQCGNGRLDVLWSHWSVTLMTDLYIGLVNSVLENGKCDVNKL